MSENDAVDVMTDRLYHHFSTTDGIPPLIQHDIEAAESPDDSVILGVSLPKLAAAILDEIDPSEWKQVANRIQSTTSSDDPRTVFCATADYFLLRDHRELDLTYLFMHKCNSRSTVRPIEPGWVDPHPLLSSMQSQRKDE